jgi:hypothetical protein
VYGRGSVSNVLVMYIHKWKICKNNTTNIKLIFSIFGDYFIPEEVTNIIGIAPTSVWRMGDPIPNLNNKFFRKETCWEYTQGYIPTLFFSEISEPFVKQFGSKVKTLPRCSEC